MMNEICMFAFIHDPLELLLLLVWFEQAIIHSTIRVLSS